MTRAAMPLAVVAAGSALVPVPRPQPGGSRSPTSPPRPASSSPTTAAAPARSGCPRRSAPACAFFDADGDGWLDLLLVNSKDWTAARAPIAPRALPQQPATARFTDITAGSGLDVEMYGMGVAVGDYDNDGRGDVYITALEGDRLFHNEGGGQVPRRDEARPASTTPTSAPAPPGSTTTATARLDLFVANYVQWTPKSDLWCSLDGATKSYCTPESYKGTASKLYRNLGGGKFEDVSRKAGRRRPDQQVARRRRPRLQRRRLARPVRRQRHAAEQALSQQQQRHVHRRGAGGGRGLRRGRRRARRHGRRRRRLRPLGPAAPAGRQLLEPDARASTTTKATACSSTRRRARPSAGRAC